MENERQVEEEEVVFFALYGRFSRDGGTARTPAPRREDPKDAARIHGILPEIGTSNRGAGNCALHRGRV